MIYAYMRISTNKQNDERQSYIIDNYCKDNNIDLSGKFVDVVSGKLETSKREQFSRLLETVNENDTIIITEVDRLGRNWEDIKETYSKLLDLGINLIVIEYDLLSIDNSKKDTSLENKLVKNLGIEIYCYSAQKEREKISQRTKDSLASMQQKGIKLGRPKVIDYTEVRIMYLQGYTYNEIVEHTGIGKSTIIKFVKDNNLKGLQGIKKKDA